jgi:alkylation response protein AidB-like acyl-CoA dehydrogenase
LEFGYTEEQEKFRKELNAWLDANVPPDAGLPAEMDELDDKAYAIARELRPKLVEKGWLHPTYPKEYGGGGLSPEEHLIWLEEFSRRRVPLLYDAGYMAGAALSRFGTEEQKKRWLPLIGQGKVVMWECFTEPEAGTDLANVQARAIQQDNGEFLLNGGKIYTGGGRPVDYLITLAVTDPAASRHRNLSMFIVKADSPGISWEALQPIAGHRKNVLHFEDVSVPADNLVGQINKGWEVTQASLVGERGNPGIASRFHLVDELIEYCRETNSNGKRLIDDPHVQELLADIYIDTKAWRLLYLRTFWKGSHGITTYYEGSQNILLYKAFLPKFAATALEILGPQALVTDPKWTVLRGKIERMERFSLLTHGAGTPEAQRIVMARFLSLPSARRSP